jgi:hypothetical protein
VLNALKRFLVGQPLRTSQAVHERLTKRVALAVFSSDALSSVADKSKGQPAMVGRMQFSSGRTGIVQLPRVRCNKNLPYGTLAGLSLTANCEDGLLSRTV